MATGAERNKWDQLLDGFRGFGGTASNVIQRPGPYGLGLFPVDPEQTSELRVPQHLLIPVERVALVDGAVILKNESGFPKGYAEWFRGFQADFSWGAEAQQTIQTFENNLQSLPTHLLNRLSSHGLISKTRKHGEAIREHKAFDRFIQTRQIQHNNSLVLMPIIELINHSPQGTAWDLSSDGVAVAGKFKDEMLVRYSISDPLNRLMQYGFNCQEPHGFSINLQFKHRNLNVVINGGVNHQPIKPCRVVSESTKLVIHQPILGSLRAPKSPLTIFRKSLKDFKVDPDELFEQIHHYNRLALIQIIRDLENVSGTLRDQLMTACLDQLTTLSYHTRSRNLD